MHPDAAEVTSVAQVTGSESRELGEATMILRCAWVTWWAGLALPPCNQAMQGSMASHASPLA